MNELIELKNEIAKLKEVIKKLQINLDEHLLEHMIEDRNKEFELEYPFEDD